YAFASAAVDVSDKKKLRPRALHGTHSGSPAMLPVDVRTLALRLFFEYARYSGEKLVSY
ncbi:MAG: hypothetical protein ACJAZO_005221, partial [Myxococcota bacterium]